MKGRGGSGEEGKVEKDEGEKEGVGGRERWR